ncbi:DUF4236 domain-containing protein [Flavobacterium sp. CYK-4]|uniref:DUF4236 domain-containing protein n=1 Tax=Flavobacterium lotistagni TaxID=2709660 RepID=UPI00140E0DF3|nr:DUF4236 domain-containing protein [Flavobacterium lotistagni]
MGFRFQKRINLGKGLGLNISNSGISPSLRTKSGSISSKGFSVKTGIPGVSYRKSYKSSGCLLLIVLYISLGGIIFKALL